MKLIKRGPRETHVIRRPGSSFYRSSALWEVKDIPGVFIYSTPRGWQLEIAPNYPTPRKLKLLYLKADNPHMPFGRPFATRRELLEALESYCQEGKCEPSLPALI